MTKKVYAQAVMDAIEKTHQKNTQSKGAALKFLKEAGIIQDDKIQPIAKSTNKVARDEKTKFLFV